MTEASVTQSLLTSLKRRFPAADVWKISDRATIGRPDVCLTRRGRSYWLEIKLLKKGDSLAKCSDELQRLTMRRLHRESKGRAWYVIYDARAKGKLTAIFDPELDVHAPLLLTSGFDHEQVAEFLEDR